MNKRPSWAERINLTVFLVGIILTVVAGGWMALKALFAILGRQFPELPLWLGLTAFGLLALAVALAIVQFCVGLSSPPPER